MPRQKGEACDREAKAQAEAEAMTMKEAEAGAFVGTVLTARVLAMIVLAVSAEWQPQRLRW